MCVQLLTAGIALGGAYAGGSFGATPGGSTTPIGDGLKLQAAATGIDALGDLALGATRARMSRADAAGEMAAARSRAKRIRTAGAAEVAQSRSDAVGAGVKLTSESVLDAQRQITRNVEQDAAVTILTGANRARGVRMSADMYEQSGVNSAIAGLSDSFGKWHKSKFADVPLVSAGADYWPKPDQAVY